MAQLIQRQGATSRMRVLADSLWSFWRQGDRLERAGYVVGAILIASGLIHLAILFITGQSWEGPLSLRKAATFGLSFGLTLVTIVWVSSFLHIGRRMRTILLGVFTFACILETMLVSLQVWRGVPSHFNVETHFDALVARTLAVGGAVLVITIATLTFAAFRSNPEVPISLLVAIRVGFVALVGAVVVGGLMIAKGMRLVFAGNAEAAYLTGGSLKPTHGVTMHAILFLPLLAWFLSFVDCSECSRLRIVLTTASGYALAAGTLALANIIGWTLTQMPVAMVAVSVGLLMMTVAVAYAVNLAGRQFTPSGIQHR